MTVATPIPPLVRRIVPSLGSSVDGEALGACRAIGRTLSAAHLDFHDLAAAIPTGETFDNVQGSQCPVWDDAGWRRAARHAFTPAQECAHREHVRFCRSRFDSLTTWERGFIDTVGRLRGNLSIRQGDQLAGIVDRLEWEVRA